jgi:NAD kinase
MKALIVCKHPTDSIDAKACQLVQQEGIETIYAWKNTLTKDKLQNIDLVISIGGDGTALSASHYLTDAPLLAVNDSPETSVGALTTISIDQLKEDLEKIKNKNYNKVDLERIQILVNNKQLDHLALNDVFIGNEKSFQMSKYTLQFNNVKENHYSSGLIFSTGTGSTAWHNSAGGQPFSPQAKYIKMIVREPYQGRIGKPKTTNLTIQETESINIIPQTESILVIDSIRQYPLKKTDMVTIKISKYPLKRIK